MKTTPTTAELFCELAKIKYNPCARPGFCMPTHEVYLPKDNQGVKRLAFGWGPSFGTVEFADYGDGFWGGLPLSRKGGAS